MITKLLYLSVAVNIIPIYNLQFLPRDAMLARYMLLSCVHLSVCPSVYLSVTRQYCTATAEYTITQTTPYDSPWTLVF